MLDAVFKTFVAQNWPTKTHIFSGGNSDFYRARPKLDGERGVLPYLCTAGQFQKFKKIPDGLYVKFSSDGVYCDIVIIECCQVFANFEQKRGKYGPSTSALLLHVPCSWMQSKIDGTEKRAEALGFDPDEWDCDYKLPVRNINVLYVLPDDLYTDIRNHCTPNHFEYFIKDSNLSNISDNSVRSFLSKLDIDSRFYA